MIVAAGPANPMTRGKAQSNKRLRGSKLPNTHRTERAAGPGPRPDFVSDLVGVPRACLSVIGRTSRLLCCPRSHIASLVRYAREAHPERPIRLRLREGPPIEGLGVLFASCEYAPPHVPFPARKFAAIDGANSSRVSRQPGSLLAARCARTAAQTHRVA